MKKYEKDLKNDPHYNNNLQTQTQTFITSRKLKLQCPELPIHSQIGLMK